MVLDEADEAPLIVAIGAEVPAYLLGVLAHETVVEALVVAVVEALLLKRPLEVPVSLGMKTNSGWAAFTAGITVGQ